MIYVMRSSIQAYFSGYNIFTATANSPEMYSLPSTILRSTLKKVRSNVLTYTPMPTCTSQNVWLSCKNAHLVETLPNTVFLDTVLSHVPYHCTGNQSNWESTIRMNLLSIQRKCSRTWWANWNYFVEIVELLPMILPRECLRRVADVILLGIVEKSAKQSIGKRGTKVIASGSKCRLDTSGSEDEQW